MPAPDLTDIIEQAASDPASTTIDGETFVDKSIKDRIEAQKFLDARAAQEGTNANGGRRSAWGAITIARAAPPAAAGDC